MAIQGANFFLINPNGMMFGANTRLNVEKIYKYPSDRANTQSIAILLSKLRPDRDRYSTASKSMRLEY